MLREFAADAWGGGPPRADGARVGSSRPHAPACRQALALPPGPARHCRAAARARATGRRARARARHAGVDLGHRRQRIAGRMDRVRRRLRRRSPLLGHRQRHRGNPRGGRRGGHEEAPRARAGRPPRLADAPLGRDRSGPRRGARPRGPRASRCAGDVAAHRVRSLAALLRRGSQRRQRPPTRPRRRASPIRTLSTARSSCSTCPISPGGSSIPEELQSDAVALLQTRESRLVVSDQIKAEREAAIIDAAVERELTPEARGRWARRLEEMALILAATDRAEQADVGHRRRRGPARRGARDSPPSARARPGPTRAGRGERGDARSGEAGRRQPQARRRRRVITDVPGIRVGHATDAAACTGVTVVLCDRPAVAAVELRGGANDVVGLDYLDPRHLVATINGVVLGGGSRFGGESIWGVVRYLEERGVGFAAGPTVVPHVPGAFLFDLNVGRRARAPHARDGLRRRRGGRGGRRRRGQRGRGDGRQRGQALRDQPRHARRHRLGERARSVTPWWAPSWP